MNTLKQEAINDLLEISKSYDTEIAHHEADSVLCDLLTELGYAEVVAAYHNVDKWYA